MFSIDKTNANAKNLPNLLRRKFSLAQNSRFPLIR